MGSVPSVSTTIIDTRSSNTTPSQQKALLVIGTSTAGTVDTITAFSSVSQLASSVGYGSGPSAVALALSNGAGTVHFYKAPASSTYISKVTSPVKTGGGTSPTFTVTGTPADHYIVHVEITKAGSEGTAEFRYSVDGIKWFGSYVVPTGLTYTLNKPYPTGITINFVSGTYATTDSFKFYCYPATIDFSTLPDIVTNIINFEYNWRHIHIVDVSHHDTDENNVTTHLVDICDSVSSATVTELENGYKFAQVYLDSVAKQASEDDTDLVAHWKTAKSDIDANSRLHVGAGRWKTVCPQTGTYFWRPSTWSYIEEHYMRTNNITTEPGDGQLGPITTLGVSLDDRRNGSDSLYGYGFWTLTTRPTKPSGYYYRSGAPSMGETESDFYFVSVGLVMDIVAEEATGLIIDFINTKLMTNSNGTIHAASAAHIEQTIRSSLDIKLVEPKLAQAIGVEVDKTNNIKVTGELKATVTAKVFGYIRQITLSVKVGA